MPAKAQGLCPEVHPTLWMRVGSGRGSRPATAPVLTSTGPEQPMRSGLHLVWPVLDPRRVTGRAGVWTGMGMGWGLQRGNWGQSLFIPRPVQPLPTLLQLGMGGFSLLVLPTSQALGGLLVLSTSRPLQSAPRNQGTQARLRGHPRRRVSLPQSCPLSH